MGWRKFSHEAWREKTQYHTSVSNSCILIFTPLARKRLLQRFKNTVYPIRKFFSLFFFIFLSLGIIESYSQQNPGPVAIKRSHTIDSLFIRFSQKYFKTPQLQNNNLQWLSKSDLSSFATIQAGARQMEDFRLWVPKTNGLQKDHVEEISGHSKNKFTLVHIYPLPGDPVVKEFYIDAGTVKVKGNVRKVGATPVLAAYCKAEFLRQNFYLQREDLMNPYTISTEGSLFNQHNLLVGGDCTIPFSSALNINVSLICKVYSNGNSQYSSSPWVFRVGIG